MNPHNTAEIELHNKKQADKDARSRILSVAVHWGWKNTNFSKKSRKRIARAACCQVAYYLGYQSEISCTMLPKWEKLFVRGIEEGNMQNPLSTKHIGSVKYCDKIEGEYILL